MVTANLLHSQDPQERSCHHKGPGDLPGEGRSAGWAGRRGGSGGGGSAADGVTRAGTADSFSDGANDTSLDAGGVFACGCTLGSGLVSGKCV